MPDQLKITISRHANSYSAVETAEVLVDIPAELPDSAKRDIFKALRDNMDQTAARMRHVIVNIEHEIKVGAAGPPPQDNMDTPI